MSERMQKIEKYFKCKTIKYYKKYLLLFPTIKRIYHRLIQPCLVLINIISKRICKIAYFIMINLSQYFFNSFNDILNADTLSLIFIDIVGILMTLFMLLIDWNTLLSNHKLVFIRPKIFFHK